MFTTTSGKIRNCCYAITVAHDFWRSKYLNIKVNIVNQTLKDVQISMIWRKRTKHASTHLRRFIVHLLQERIKRCFHTLKNTYSVLNFALFK